MKDYKVNQNSKKEALISIIVPSFNVEKYIAEALDSILAQSYSNWECIIIDDHSTDDTVSIISGYIQRFPDKFKYYVNPKKGACAARNFGLTIAKGEFLKFLDSDDAIFDGDTLCDQLSFLTNNGLDIVFGVEHYFKNEFEEKNLVKTRGSELNENNVNIEFFTRFPITSNFLMRSPSGIDIKWSERLKSGQEFHFLFMSLLNRLKFGFIDTPTAKIRIHSSVHRISNKTPAVYVQQTFDLINQLTYDLEEYNYTDRDFISAFNVWKLRWSFSAFRVKNVEIFKSIQKDLLKPSLVKIQNAEVRFLYRLNSFSPYMALAFYEIFKKTMKRDVLRGSLQ